jgi:hypothetical protein
VEKKRSPDARMRRGAEGHYAPALRMSTANPRCAACVFDKSRTKEPTSDKLAGFSVASRNHICGSGEKWRDPARAEPRQPCGDSEGLSCQLIADHAVDQITDNRENFHSVFNGR